MSSSLSIDVMDTPIGQLLLAATDIGVVRVAFAWGGLQQVQRELDTRFPAHEATSESELMLARLRSELNEYFEGTRRRFEVPLDERLSTGFQLRAQRTLMDVPYGQTVSYGELAVMTGAPRAARAAGTACARNPIAILHPCHRVIRSDGSLGQFGGSPRTKAELIALERHHRVA